MTIRFGSISAGVSVRPRPCKNGVGFAALREDAQLGRGSVVEAAEVQRWALRRVDRLERGNGLELGAKKGSRAPCPERSKHFADAQDPHYALQVIGQDVQTYFGAHARQRLGQKVGPTHPALDRAERVLDRLSS